MTSVVTSVVASVVASVATGLAMSGVTTVYERIRLNTQYLIDYCTNVLQIWRKINLQKKYLLSYPLLALKLRNSAFGKEKIWSAYVRLGTEFYQFLRSIIITFK